MRTVQKADITEKDLEKILNLGIELNSINKAIYTLIKEGVVKDYCTSTYEYRIGKMPKHTEWINLKKARRKNNTKLAIMMKKRGRTMQYIATALKTNKGDVYYLVNPKKQLNKVKRTAERNAKKLVNDWNKYNIENRFPTDETIKAFELLNLTPPQRL